MKKTIYIIATIALLSACKKQLSSSTEQPTVTYLRIKEVDNNGNTTVSPIVIIKYQR